MQPPTLDEVLTHARTIGLPENEAKKCWLYWDEVGWKRKGVPIVRWKSSIARWKINWEEWSQPKETGGRCV